jgi:hypothetical protein
MSWKPGVFLGGMRFPISPREEWYIPYVYKPMTNAAQSLVPEVHPLRAAIATAEAAYAAASDVVSSLGENETVGADDPRWIAACDADAAAYQALIAARGAIAGSDCPRLWDLSEGGHVYDSTVATSAEDALETARDNVDRGNYNDAEGTLWIDVRVHCRETDESESGTVQLDEDEPECSDLEHSWQSPIELVGGIKENPGVWGHGGGVIITEVCMHCGCKKITDTCAFTEEELTEAKNE